MKVLISHSDTDSLLARRIATKLAAEGIETWTDSDILPGDNWAAKHSEALESADAMVVLLTPESVKSKGVALDVLFALGQERYRRRVIPFLVNISKDDLGENIPWVLKRFSSVSLDEMSEEKEREAIETLSSRILDPDASNALSS